MSDRASRAELERVQGALKAARAQLAEQMDAGALRREVSDALDRLAQEGHVLKPQLDVARADLASARAWHERQKGVQSPGRLPRGWQRALWLILLASAVVAAPLLLMSLAERPGWLPILLFVAGALLVGWELGDGIRHRSKR